MDVFLLYFANNKMRYLSTSDYLFDIQKIGLLLCALASVLLIGLLLGFGHCASQQLMAMF